MSRDFDGIDDLINVGSPSILDDLHGADVTIGCWLNPRTTGEGGLGTIWDSGSGNNSGFALLARDIGAGAGDDDAYQISAFYSTTSMLVKSNNFEVSINAWQHLLFEIEFSLRRGRIFKNGLELTYATQTDGSGSVLSDAGENKIIGNRDLADRTTDGLLAELGVWTVRLSGDEKLALANGISPNQIRRDQLVLYLPLYGAGSPEADLSGNRNNGSLTGTLSGNHSPSGRLTSTRIPYQSIFVPATINFDLTSRFTSGQENQFDRQSRYMSGQGIAPVDLIGRYTVGKLSTIDRTSHFHIKGTGFELISQYATDASRRLGLGMKATFFNDWTDPITGQSTKRSWHDEGPAREGTPQLVNRALLGWSLDASSGAFYTWPMAGNIPKAEWTVLVRIEPRADFTGCTGDRVFWGFQTSASDRILLVYDCATQTVIAEVSGTKVGLKQALDAKKPYVIGLALDGDTFNLNIDTTHGTETGTAPYSRPSKFGVGGIPSIGNTAEAYIGEIVVVDRRLPRGYIDRAVRIMHAKGIRNTRQALVSPRLV